LKAEPYFIPFTQEMIDESSAQSMKRERFIKHHFESDVMSSDVRNQVGFLGEFACCVALGLDWKKSIRENYDAPDHFDIIFRGKRIDVKTQVTPTKFLIPQRHFLVSETQKEHIKLSDYIVSGAISREKMNGWHPIGYAPTEVLDQIEAVTHHSVSGTKYYTKTIEIPIEKFQPLGGLMENYGVTEGVGGEHEEVIEDAERFVEINHDEPHEDLREASRIIRGLLDLI